MATLTIRNVPPRIVKQLKALARQSRRSMEQEVKHLLEESVEEHLSVLDQIKRSWAAQRRRPTGAQIDKWIASGRP